MKPLPTSYVVIFIDASDVAFGEFSCNLNVFFRLAACGLRMKRARVLHIESLQLYVNYVNYSNAIELENKEVKVLMDKDKEATIVLVIVPNHIYKH